MPTMRTLNGLHLQFKNLKVDYFLPCLIKTRIILQNDTHIIPELHLEWGGGGVKYGNNENDISV